MVHSKVNQGVRVVFMIVLIICLRETCEGLDASYTVIPLKVMTGDAKLNFTQLAVKYGRDCEEHRVITKDGYVLTLFRVPGDRSRPVLLQHGTLGSADDFIIRGRTSLAIALSDAGYDVWVANTRGNQYSRRHLTLNPDFEEQYWDFTVQEVIVNDFTAVIDYILTVNQQEKLATIGYSVGTALSYALMAEMPEYNDKIQVMISLAPICYTFHSLPLSIIHFLSPVYDMYSGSLGIPEVTGRTVRLDDSRLECLKRFRYLGTALSSWVCLQKEMSFLPGYNTEEIEPEFSEVIMTHFPSSEGWKLMFHFSQIGLNRRFAKYDYGLVQNLMRYGSPLPPEYGLSLISTKVVLISGKNDRISTLDDVALLKVRLSNVEHIILEPENFSHTDFIWGKNTHETLFPYILDILKSNNDKYT